MELTLLNTTPAMHTIDNIRAGDVPVGVNGSDSTLAFHSTGYEATGRPSEPAEAATLRDSHEPADSNATERRLSPFTEEAMVRSRH